MEETMPKYTINPGRHIYRDGKQFIYIGRNHEGAAPHEADDMARLICRLLNEYEAGVLKHER